MIQDYHYSSGLGTCTKCSFQNFCTCTPGERGTSEFTSDLVNWFTLYAAHRSDCFLTQTQTLTLILIDYTLSHLVSFWGTHTIFKVIYNWPNKTSYRRTIQTKSVTLRTNEVCRFAKNENKTAGLNQVLCFTNYQWINSRRWSALVLNRQNMP